MRPRTLSCGQRSHRVAPAPHSVGARGLELADLWAAEVGATEALRELTPIAGPRMELLADHLINTAPEHIAAELLVEKAARLNRCDYALAAAGLDPGLRPDALPPDCRRVVEASRRAIAGRRYGKQYLTYFEQRNLLVERWDALGQAVRAGDRAPEPWLGFAEDAAAMRVIAMNAERVEEVDTIARAALLVAVALLPSPIRGDDALVSRIRRATRALGHRHHGRVLERLDERMPRTSP